MFTNINFNVFRKIYKILMKLKKMQNYIENYVLFLRVSNVSIKI